LEGSRLPVTPVRTRSPITPSPGRPEPLQRRFESLSHAERNTEQNTQSQRVSEVRCRITTGTGCWYDVHNESLDKVYGTSCLIYYRNKIHQYRECDQSDQVQHISSAIEWNNRYCKMDPDSLGVRVGPPPSTAIWSQLQTPGGKTVVAEKEQALETAPAATDVARETVGKSLDTAQRASETRVRRPLDPQPG
jgi:hypothetical protein